MSVFPYIWIEHFHVSFNLQNRYNPMAAKYRLFILLVASMVVVSCKSNEQKAEELIREDLSKTLLDFDSYEPIETSITPAYETPYNHLGCHEIALVAAEHIEQAKEYSDEMEEAIDYMNIWGAPTHYSSSYSDRQYYKHKEQAKENLEKLEEEMQFIKTAGLVLQDTIKTLNSEKVIGWEVKHRFRCKTRGGHSTIADYRYIVDKDFKTILFQEDMDSDDYSRVRGIIGMAEKNEFPYGEETSE